MTQKIIVTGASGFVGRHVIHSLLESGHEVFAMTRHSKNLEKFDWFNKVSIIEHDLNDRDIRFSVPENAILIHLAWEGLPNYKDNFHFERNLLQSYSFIKKMVQKGVSQVAVTGTCFEYGMQDGALYPHTTTDPQNPYALAKDCLRKFLENLQNEMPFTLQWIRLFYMYGAGQNPKSILAQLDTAIENNDEVFNMSGGEQLRDYLPIETIAHDLAEIVQSKKDGCYNICSENPISIRRLVENRIKEKGSNIKMNLGYYPYPDYEPMAFWGKKGNKNE